MNFNVFAVLLDRITVSSAAEYVSLSKALSTGVRPAILSSGTEYTSTSPRDRKITHLPSGDVAISIGETSSLNCFFSVHSISARASRPRARRHKTAASATAADRTDVFPMFSSFRQVRFVIAAWAIAVEGPTDLP